MKASQITSTQVTLGLGLVAVIAVYFVGYRTLKAAKGAADSLVDVVATGVQQINPLNPNNGFYTAASGIGDAIASDGRSAPLGSRLFELFNPGKVAAENALTGPVQQATRSVAEVGYWTPDGMVDAMGNFTGDYAHSSRGATGNW